MGSVVAIVGVVFLLVGVVLVALWGNRRTHTWAPYVGVALAIIGLGVEVIGAVSA